MPSGEKEGLEGRVGALVLGGETRGLEEEMSRLSARGKRVKSIQEREAGFSLSSAPAPLPTYDALRDANLRQHFESRGVQRFLQAKGWVDKTGRIIDLDKYRSKLNIIEQEFKYAEKTEQWRLKEEEEMRRTIQLKRERALQEAKRQERARKIKEENRIRKGIILAAKNAIKPEEKAVQQHLDMTVGSPENHKGQHLDVQRGDEEREEEEWRNRQMGTSEGGFFVTQSQTD